MRDRALLAWRGAGFLFAGFMMLPLVLVLRQLVEAVRHLEPYRGKDFSENKSGNRSFIGVNANSAAHRGKARG